MSYILHQAIAAAAPTRSLCCAVLTCSDTRRMDNDLSGQIIHRLLLQAQHRVGLYQILPDDPNTIECQLDAIAADTSLQAVLLHGGTGIAPRDNTFDAVSRKLTKVLPGFGELFRFLSFQTIGSGAMLSRAIAGIYGPPDHPVILFSMPGSPQAVELAMTRLIIPELPHLVWESLRKA